jgi:hypothetical protein
MASSQSQDQKGMGARAKAVCHRQSNRARVQDIVKKRHLQNSRQGACRALEAIILQFTISSMAFSVVSKKSGKTYYLHARLQKLRGGQEVTLYYFAGQPGSGAIDALPAGYKVSENEKTGLPLLKKG